MSEITTDIQAKSSPFSADPMSVLCLPLVGAFTVKVVHLVSKEFNC